MVGFAGWEVGRPVRAEKQVASFCARVEQRVAAWAEPRAGGVSLGCRRGNSAQKAGPSELPSWEATGSWLGGCRENLVLEEGATFVGLDL